MKISKENRKRVIPIVHVTVTVSPALRRSLKRIESKFRQVYYSLIFSIERRSLKRIESVKVPHSDSIAPTTLKISKENRK